MNKEANMFLLGVTLATLLMFCIAMILVGNERTTQQERAIQNGAAEMVCVDTNCMFKWKDEL